VSPISISSTGSSSSASFERSPWVTATGIVTAATGGGGGGGGRGGWFRPLAAAPARCRGHRSRAGGELKATSGGGSDRRSDESERGRESCGLRLRGGGSDLGLGLGRPPRLHMWQVGSVVWAGPTGNN
jgi:hypothetical protein